MRVVLTTLGLIMLCLLTTAAEEVPQRFDTDGDGRFDLWQYYVEDTLTRLEKDRDFDGRVDFWVTYEDGEMGARRGGYRRVGRRGPARVLWR